MSYFLYLFPLILILNFTFGHNKCGYKSCHATFDDKLNVHLVAHTHDDVGWLKTVDQYYYGSKERIDPSGVQYILDSVIQELLHDSNKKFIYVEMAFFWRWWNEQNDHLKHKVKRLVNNGQLEFINGGWCMNDEAATHYNAIIDQMSLGMEWLNETFGECGRPKIAWQIDPFGHSREQANIFAQMGFDGLFFGRLDYQDFENRGKHKTREMLWKGRHHDKSSILFTGVLPNLYQPPEGFCFDRYCGDDPIMDDPNMEDYNVDYKVRKFIEIARNQSKLYATNHIIMTMGSDFQYSAAHMWFKNLDKLIKYVGKADPSINLIYSTPSCYLKSLYDSNIKWPSKRDDFFPYASGSHSYWTGYFTSRPTLKRMVRESNNVLQICKQIEVTASLEYVRLNVSILERAMGVAQHHDAVSGTAKQAVTNDYALRLSKGLKSCSNVISSAFQKIYGNSLEFCPLLNITQCNFSESSNKFNVHVYNPLARKVSKFIRIPVVHKSGYQVMFGSKSLPIQIIPIPNALRNIPGRNSKANYELVFLANHLPPLSYKSFKITWTTTKASQYNPNDLTKVMDVTKEDEITIGNDLIKLTFGSNGTLTHMTHGNKDPISISQSFFWYEGFPGNNTHQKFRASGAYIFRPLNDTPNKFQVPQVKVYRGRLVQEMHFKYNSWLYQIARVYKGDITGEFEWMVGPIPIDDGLTKEVITRYHANNIQSNGIFYTDSNGRQNMRRKRNQRSTWNYTITEPVSGNYYPVNSHIYIQDSHNRLSILTDRSQGGSSLEDGQIELMIHRRTLYDDAKGVNEPLNETAHGTGLVAKGKHWILLEDPVSFRASRFLAQEKFMDVMIAFSSLDKLEHHETHSETALNENILPVNVHLLTLQKTKHGDVLIRFEHFFDSHEDSQYSKSVEFSIQYLFKNYNIDRIEEVALGANVWKKDLKPLFRKTNYDDNNSFANDPFTINLKPMEIKSFIIELSRL